MNIAAYCRVSTDKEDQLNSLEAQKRFFADYTKRTGDNLVRLYADEGISGTKIKNRKEFLKMMSDAEKGLFETVVVKDISRFARNTVDLLQNIRKLKALGIETQFLTANMTSMGNSEFVLTIFGALAQEESAHLSKRIKFGKDINARRGRVPPVIFGYTRTGLFSLRIQPREAETVREMFRLYLAGMGAAGIAAHLNHVGRFTKRGNRWDARGVRRCLDNSIYCGVFVNHKSTVVDYLEGKTQALPQQDWYVHARPEWAIVSRELFEAVQGERRRRRAIAAQGKACGTNRNT